MTARPGSTPSSRSSRASLTVRWNSVRLGSPVRASCSDSCRSWSSSRPFCRATLAWLATVSSSCRSDSSKVRTSPSRSATVMVPMTPASPRSGTTTASGAPSSASRRRWASSLRAAGQQLGGAAGGDPRVDRAGPHEHVGLAPHQAVAAVDADVRGRSAARRQEHHVGALGVQQLLGLQQHRAQHALHLRVRAHRLAEPVEPLQGQVALGQGGVRAVGQQHDAGRGEQRQGRAGVERQRVDRDERQRRHGHGPAGVEQGHRPQVPQGEPALVRRDDDGRRGRRHRAGGADRGEGRAPRPQVVAHAVDREEPEHRDRHQGVGQEQADVVGDLQRGLPTVQQQDGQRPEDAGEHQRQRRGEEQAEDERDLVQRHGLRLAAHLHVQDEDLDHAEHEEQHPERQVPAGRDGASGAAGQEPARRTRRAAAR